MATNLWQNLGICVHSAEWRLTMACNIATQIKNIKWQYTSYILCKYDENLSGNPRDYVGNKWNAPSPCECATLIALHRVERW